MYGDIRRKISFPLALILLVSASIFMLPADTVFGGTAYTDGSISYQRSWFGNTYNGDDNKWVQNYIDQMFVTPDGTCYTSGHWDEGQRFWGVYKDGDVIGNENHRINTRQAAIDGVTWTIQADNTITGGGKTISDVILPTALAVANNGQLMVAENGPRKQVLFYDVSAATPVLAGAFGEEGGIAAGTPGVVTPTKFWGLSGIGMDSSGNIYVSGNGKNYVQSSFIRKFQPDGTLVWEVRDDIFMDIVSADPSTNGTDVYGVNEHYILDYSKTAPGTEAELYAFTMDENKYPNDPRIFLQSGSAHGQTSPYIRYIDGRKFMFIFGTYNAGVGIYRFDGEIAVPAGFIAEQHIEPNQDNPAWPPYQPASGGWIWNDLNGDGDFQENEYVDANGASSVLWATSVDEDGNIWEGYNDGSIVRINCQGLNAYGCPMYDRKHVTAFQIPSSPFTQVTRVDYIASSDTMYVSGYTAENPQTGLEWGMVGTEIRRYDNFTTHPTLHAGYPIVLPYDCSPNENKPTTSGDMEKRIVVKSFCVVNDKIFCAYFTKGPEGTPRGEIRVYEANSGQYLGTMKPGGFVGWIDFPLAITGIQRTDGEYEIFVEEDGRGKVLLYRVAGAAPILDTEAPTAPGSFKLVSNTDVKATFSWTASTDNERLAGYYIYANGNLAAAAPADATSCTVAGLDPSTAYSFTIKARDYSYNKSADSNALNVTTLTRDTEAPTVPSGLKAFFITDESIAFSWNASADNIGVTGYDIYKDGEYAGTTNETHFSLEGLNAAVQYSITVKAKDEAGNISAAGTALNTATSEAIPRTTVDDADVSIQYTGTWSAHNDWNGCLNNTAHESNTGGAEVQYTFTGTSIRLIGMRAPWGGIGDVYLDGILQGTVNFNAPNEERQIEIFTKSGLAPAAHTLKLSVKSGWNYADAFIYTPCEADTQAPTVIIFVALLVLVGLILFFVVRRLRSTAKKK